MPLISMKLIVILLEPIIVSKDLTSLMVNFYLSSGILHFTLEGNALKAIEINEQLAQDIHSTETTRICSLIFQALILWSFSALGNGEQRLILSSR